MSKYCISSIVLGFKLTTIHHGHCYHYNIDNIVWNKVGCFSLIRSPKLVKYIWWYTLLHQKRK